MIEKTTHPATPDGAATIRCAECGAPAPVERVRYREERVRVETRQPAVAWRGPHGPPLARPARPVGAGHTHQIKRVPICLDCRRRQRTGFLSVCAFVAACSLAALFIYSRDAAPPQPTTLALAPPPHPTAATPRAPGAAPTRAPAAAPPNALAAAPTRAPAAAPTSAPDAPVVVSTPLPAPTPSSAPKSVTPSKSAPVPAAPSDTSQVAASTAPPAATDTAAPAWRSDDPAPDAQPPVWRPERKTRTASRKPAATARDRAELSPDSAQSLRASGYSALQNRSFGQALWQLERAANLGDAYAPMYIGEMFQYGLGVGRDTGQASYWYGIAVNRGNAAALAAFQRLRMSPY